MSADGLRHQGRPRQPPRAYRRCRGRGRKARQTIDGGVAFEQIVTVTIRDIDGGVAFEQIVTVTIRDIVPRPRPEGRPCEKKTRRGMALATPARATPSRGLGKRFGGL